MFKVGVRIPRLVGVDFGDRVGRVFVVPLCLDTGVELPVAFCPLFESEEGAADCYHYLRGLCDAERVSSGVGFTKRVAPSGEEFEVEVE